MLVDPAAERLELVAGVGRRILARQGHPGRLVTTTTLEPALDGADAVLLQLRVGGQAARNQDETWPLECGCVGQETTGAGGLAKALRTVPVVLDIAERVAEAAPDAWIIDFTNPVGIVTRALLQAGHRAVGLCNVAIGFQRRFAALLGVPPESLELDHVGLNHLTWERAARVDGVDRLPELLAAHVEEIAVVGRAAARAAALARRRAVVLPALLLRPRRGGPRAAARRRRGPPRWPRSSGSCWSCTPTRRSTRSRSCWRSAAARSTPRPRCSWPRRCSVTGRPRRTW